MQCDQRLIAFYLPQYHPIPENDEWWGKGFTEWRNVVHAKPRFPWHYQPHYPSELGYYDLRVPETREAQADLARAHGVYGFCYYHYWFSGKRLLNRPFDEVLEFGKPAFPFCLCWANENWTRAWDGAANEILIGQDFSEEDQRNHVRWLMRAFADERYIRIDGKPLFLVYRANRIPQPSVTTSLWRDEARKAGLGELYLCKVESFPEEHGDPMIQGFDAAVEFAPDITCLPPTITEEVKPWSFRKFRYVKQIHSVRNVFPYAGLIERMLAKPDPAYRRFPCVMPSWDNTARRQTDAVVFKDACPESYGNWLKQVLLRERTQQDSKGVVFINAWNEWAEGNHLEPCERWGRGYLEATRLALQGSANTPDGNVGRMQY